MQASNAAAAVTTLLRPLQLPAIGTHWVEQGGIFAGLVRGQNGAPDCALIVAAEPAAAFEGIAWGEYGKKIEGADSYFDGQANTQAMAAAGSELAQRIGGLIVDGFNDWYLPAQAELQLCRANVTELFQTEEWYWSSTQYSPFDAWAQDFENGNSNVGYKDNELRAVAVRRFAL